MRGTSGRDKQHKITQVNVLGYFSGATVVFSPQTSENARSGQIHTGSGVLRKPLLVG
jgi:hypothetical protein